MTIEVSENAKIVPMWKFLRDSGVCKSQAEAKNEIKQGAIKIKGVAMTENHYLIVDEDSFHSIVEIKPR